MANTTDADTLKSQQRAWLVNVRNKCQDSACLVRVHKGRITALNAISEITTPGQEKVLNNIILGRCHMNSCWRCKVEEMENLQANKTGKLVKLYTRSTNASYTDAEIDKHDYPSFPAKNAKWDGISESFIFCPEKLPAYMDYDAEKKKFIAVVPLDQDGMSGGASEGVGHLYY